MSSNPAQARRTRYSIMWYSLSVTCDRSVVFFRGNLVSSNNENHRHDITEILLKVALDTIILSQKTIMLYLFIKFIPLREESFSPLKSSFTPPLSIEMPVPSQSCICVLGLPILPLFVWFFIGYRNCLTVFLLLFFFHFINHSYNYEKKDETAIQTNRTITSHHHSLNTHKRDKAIWRWKSRTLHGTGTNKLHG